jgi:hypothetical protein
MIAVIKTPSRANPPCAWLEMAVSGIVIRWMAGTYSGQLTFKGNSRTESCWHLRVSGSQEGEHVKELAQLAGE